MKRIIQTAGFALALTLATASAWAGEFSNRTADGAVYTTHCDYSRVYGTHCYSYVNGTGNSAKVIHVPEAQIDEPRSDKPFNCPSCADVSHDPPFHSSEPSW